MGRGRPKKSVSPSPETPNQNSHQILSNAKSPSIENEINTYSVSEQKKKEIGMGLQISLGQNGNEKNRNIKRNIFVLGL